MRINSGKVKRIKDPDGLEYKIRNIDDFLDDAFSFPKEQEHPYTHYEVKPFAVVGCIASGKSTFATQFIGTKLIERWGSENIEFLYARDLWATTEAVKQSRKRVLYIIIDDSIPIFDSRTSMKSENIAVTQYFYEIRHELRKHALASGGNAGGLVFICLIAQDLGAIDVRLRTSLGFTVYKTYDRGIEKGKFELEIIRTLKKMRYQSVVCCNYFYRQLAVIIDCEDKYTLAFNDTRGLPHVQFDYILSEDIHESQREHLLQFLIDNISPKDKKWYIKASVVEQIAKMGENGDKIKISNYEIEELILLARKRVKDLRENKFHNSEKRHKLREDLLGYLVENVSPYKQKWYSKASLVEQIDILQENGDKIDISNTEMEKIILLAKKKAFDKIDEARKLEEKNQENLISTEDGTWDISEILYFKDVLNMSFKAIEREYGIPHSTCQRQYNKFLETQNSKFSSLEKGKSKTQ